MTDRLIIPLPPMTNSRILGLASAAVVDPDSASQLRSALEGGTTDEVQRLASPAAQALHGANSEYFRFDLSGAIGADEPKLIGFGPGLSMRRLGLGLHPDRSDRKLVALLVLATTGANPRLVLDQPNKSVDAAPGLLVMVPSYCDLAFTGDEDGQVTVAAFHAFGRAFR